MRLQLSKRLKTIADMITPGRVTADIGCDHGLVSVYLVQGGIAPFVYAMDIGKGPLEAAEKNIREFLSAEDRSKIELRISDGFKALSPGETEAAVIAGMGGQLIISILTNGLHNSVISPGYELLLSPQSDVPMVRTYLRETGFDIIDEEMLSEDGKYYNIIKTVFIGDSVGGDDISQENIATETDKKHTGIIMDDLYDRYGRILLEKKSPILREYLEKEVEKKEKLFCSLSKKSTEGSINRLVSLRSEIELAATALDYFG